MLGGSADRLCTPSTSAGPFRIFAVTGFQNRTNDIVYCPPIIKQTTENVEDSTAIVYFGGDVQDFPESMETNRDSRGYMKYNLENSAILLREAFPKSHIIVIRPVRMEFKTFSCFDNFVRGNNAGVPDHTPMNHALQHLEKLLQNLSQRLISIPESEIMAQAAVAAAAAVTTSIPETTNAAMSTSPNAITTGASSTINTTTCNNSEINQEMDIDILQVQDNVIIDCDGTVAFSSSNSTPVSSVNNNPNSNSMAASEASQITNATSHSSSSDSNTSSISPNRQKQHDGQQLPNDVHHLNNTSSGSSNSNNGSSINNSNSNDCHHLHQQQSDIVAHNQANRNPLWWRENLNLDKSKLILIGFSKGCVVLNQFIYEFHYLKTLTPDDSTMIRLLSRIKDMYWLDGGHGGQKNTWITSRSLLETLTRMGMNIHVHLTPYQVQDERRPWIRKEEKIFTDMLRRLGAPIKRHLHYENQTANLMTHFEVLQAFCQHIHSFQQLQQQQQQQQPPVTQSPQQTTNEVQALNQPLQQSQSIQFQQQITQNKTGNENLIDEK